MKCPSCSDEMQIANFEPPVRFGANQVAKARGYLVCLKCAIYKMREFDEAKDEGK